METEFRFLDEDLSKTIHQTMLESFADYQLDMSYMTYERFVFRAKMGRVRFGNSVGAFAGGELVGFTNIGIDHYKDCLSAYDAGTGIIKPWRGKGIAGRMFDFAIPKLKESGVRKFYLEVLQENEPAIKAYRKSGFDIEREYNCYKAEVSKLRNPESGTRSGILLKPLAKEEVKNFGYLFDDLMSWENNFDAVAHTNNELEIFGAFEGDYCAGLIVFCPVLSWIMMLGVAPDFRNRGIASALLQRVVSNLDSSIGLIKMANITPENPTNGFLLSKGFELYVKQYEMVCSLA